MQNVAFKGPAGFHDNMRQIACLSDVSLLTGMTINHVATLKVVTLNGIVTKGAPTMVLLSYCEYGALLELLRARVRCTFFRQKPTHEDALSCTCFALLEALPCVGPMAFLSGVRSSYQLTPYIASKH